MPGARQVNKQKHRIPATNSGGGFGEYLDEYDFPANSLPGKVFPTLDPDQYRSCR